jgi:NAD-specific glutamate dehydrogenase
LLNAFLDDLLLVRRGAVRRAIGEHPESSPADALAQFLARRPAAVARLERLIEQFRADGMHDLAVLTVVLRQVRATMS